MEVNAVIYLSFNASGDERQISCERECGADAKHVVRDERVVGPPGRWELNPRTHAHTLAYTHARGLAYYLFIFLSKNFSHIILYSDFFGCTYRAYFFFLYFRSL